MTEREDWIWLAGLLEGEGHFQLRSGKGLNIQVRLSMTDRDVVERAAAVMARGGGSGRVHLHNHPADGHTRQQGFRFIVCGKAAVRVMERIRPHMGERRGARIDGILEAHRAHTR